jgi:hypothetical protein
MKNRLEEQSLLSAKFLIVIMPGIGDSEYVVVLRKKV